MFKKEKAIDDNITLDAKSLKKRKKKEEIDDSKTDKKKEKVKTENEEKPREVIFNLMLAKMRPLTMQTVCDALHNTIKKKDCQQILDEMVAEGIVCSNSTSSKIYWINQSKLRTVDPALEADLDETTIGLLEKLEEIEEKKAALEAELEEVMKITTTQQLVKAVEDKEREEQKLFNKIEVLIGTELCEWPEMEIIIEAYEKEKNRHLALRANFMSVVAYIADKTNSSNKEVKTNLGIEDEDIDEMRKRLVIEL